MTYTFEQIKEAVEECTNYTLQMVVEDDELGYELRDGNYDRDGDLFYDLDDVLDYVTNNEQVAEYLTQQ